MTQKPLISVIIPIHNGEQWIDECFESILKQDVLRNADIELSVYNDASNDSTSKMISIWEKKLCDVPNMSIVVSEGKGVPKGVGFAKNVAVKQSHGEYLCFQDIDDLMLPGRISAQLKEAKKYPDAIIGCQVKRIPENSTPRFVSWANSLPQHLLTVQIYTSHGPTVLMPTWFFHRGVFEKAGKFSEEGRGTSEDLIFFYTHLNGGGTVRRVDEVLVVYRYHPCCTTFSVSKETIWDIRIEHLEQWVLPKWDAFTIWNAGKQGRRLYRSLKASSRAKVSQFCDVDPKKTGKYYEPHFKTGPGGAAKIPIVHFTKAKPPFITCVKLDLTDGHFERNLNSLKLVEGKDFVVFS